MTKDEPDVLGLVLVGGQSLRMGEPKAHLLVDNVPQWRRTGDVLRSICQAVYYSTSKNLIPPLPLSPNLLIPDVLEPIGPLGGVISAFKRYPEHALFILACDMPFFDQEAAQFLLDHRDSHKKASLFVRDGFIEPLCGIYEPTIFEDLLKFWARGVYCPRKIAGQLDINQVSVPNPQWLLNINHPHEISQPPQKTVTVYYYAMLAEQAKISQEEVKTHANNMGQLFLELKDRYGFVVNEESLRFAKNNTLVSAVCELTDQDEVVFIPPVSGG